MTGISGVSGVVEADVVVVGGGPVGLVVACELAVRGVRVVVLESEVVVSERPRATTVHARAVQCLVRRGYLGGLVEWGTGGGSLLDGDRIGVPGLGYGEDSGLSGDADGMPDGAGVPGRGCGEGSGLSDGVGAGRDGAGVLGAGLGAGLGSGGGGVGFHFGGLGGLVVSAPGLEPVAVLKCGQEVLERHFEERARGLGVRVLRGCRVVGVRQWRGGVVVTARGAFGSVVCRGLFVVGADGARSVVREQGGFESQVYPATVSALAGDVRVEGGALRVGWHRTERGWIVVKEGVGGRLRLRTVNCVGPCAWWRVEPTLEELRREVSWIAGREVVLGEPLWLSRFSDFSRVASSYRRGRVFLAGDAAHVHFPVGGQGLSTGLLDAVDLGWKLAFAVRGWAGEGLLDSYDVERRPAAQRVIAHTRAQVALMRPGPEVEPLRALFVELLAGGGEAGVLASMVSAQDTVLPARGRGRGYWEGRFLPNVELVTGEGCTDVIALLGGGQPLLLLFGARGAGGGFEEQARGWAGLVRVVHCEEVAGLECAALLVRPDGYVAWASGWEGPAGVLEAYFGAPRHPHTDTPASTPAPAPVRASASVPTPASAPTPTWTTAPTATPSRMPVLTSTPAPAQASSSAPASAQTSAAALASSLTPSAAPVLASAPPSPSASTAAPAFSSAPVLAQASTVAPVLAQVQMGVWVRGPVGVLGGGVS
ncbi:FAD-dependent monooxygenase [Streptomyces sp. NPDC048256]|uniref:FAD-dependent monooxygenase n=1 Tax=Streptomyces sp. NPDC048256 TaxID=3154613 RepID=UPI0033E828A6